MRNFKSVSTAIVMAAASFSAAAIAQNASAQLTISMTGIEEQQGKILGVLFDNEAAYESGSKPVRQIMVTVNGAEVSTSIDGLTPGTYAIKLFHDVDGDMKMSTNPYGIPVEPYAFSNNAPANMGPAKWAAAKFEIKAGGNTHTIQIR